MPNRFKKLFFYSLSLFFLLWGATSNALQAKSITVCTDDYPPSEMVLIEDDPRIGFANDIIKDIFEKHGYEVNFNGVPYERGLELTKLGDCDLIAQVVPGDEKDLLEPKTNLFTYKSVYLVNVDSDWVYSGVDSLKKIRVGNVGGFYYGDDPAVADYMNNKENDILTLRGIDATERIITMIAEKRLDTININSTIALYYAEKLGLKDKLKVAPTSEDSDFVSRFYTVPGFSSISPESAKLIEIWDKERELINNEIGDYLKKYGIN